MKRPTKKQCLEFLNKIADIKEWRPDSSGEVIDCFFSKIDGSFITFVSLTTDVRWMIEMGITEQIQSTEKDGNTSQIGFNPNEQKWYGWSHRAVFGFGIGSEVKRGDSGYTSKFNGGKGEWKAETLEDAKQMAIDFAKSVS